MPTTVRGNNWILVLTDHFTWWADALAISDASAPTVARAFHQQVFCYFGLPEQIHSDQGAQLQTQLMSDLCKTWGVNQSRTTPYHLQGNGVVEWNSRMLGDSLRSLLIGNSQEEWDLVLPEIMRAYRSTPHSSTLENPNFLMLGRKRRVPEHVTYHVLALESSVHDYVDELVKCMRTAHEMLREQQWHVRSDDSDDLPLYMVGDWVWMTSHCWRHGQAAKLQPKFVGPYCVIEVMLNHPYKVVWSGQASIQNEARPQPYWVSSDTAGQAPLLLKPARRPPMRGQGMAYREIEEVLPDQEGAADAPTDPPRSLWPPPPQEEVDDTPEDWSEPAPPSVEPADTPVTPDEIVIPQIREEEAVREEPPVLVDPLPHSGDTTRGGRVTSSSKSPNTVGP